MSLFSKQIDKRIAAYQRELIETHAKCGAGGMTIATTFRQ